MTAPAVRRTPSAGRLVAGLLAFGVAPLLLTTTPVRAQEEEPVDHDPEAPIPEEPPSPERALQLIGEDRFEEAFVALERRRAESAALARSLLGEATDPATLIGAAVWSARVEPPRAGKPGEPPDPRLRTVRARLVGAKGPLLLALLEARGALGLPEDLGALQAVSADATDEAQVLAAARGLCRAKDAEGLRLLLGQVETWHRQVPTPAEDDGALPESPAEGLGPETRIRRAADALQWLARSPDAARLVEAARFDPTVPELVAALCEVRPEAAREEARDLGRRLLDEDDADRRVVGVRLLGASNLLTGEDRERVQHALDDADAGVRAAGAAAAWTLQLRGATARLIELLEDPERPVRDAAHASLKKLAGVALPARRATWELWHKQQAEKQQREKAAQER